MERSQHLFKRWHDGGRGRAAKPRRGRFVWFAVLCFFSLPLNGGRAVAGEPPALEAIAPAVQAEVRAGRIPGAVVLVGTGGRVVYRAAFGMKALEPVPAAMSPSDIFDLASLTKVVATTTAVMQLVEAGGLELDRPVAAYWPAFAANGKAQVTVRQLLTHTSGLPADLDLSTGWEGETEGLARAAGARLASPPGARFVYSDINFIVLGELVHRVSGEALDSYARDHIFAPLGMSDTGFRPSAAQRQRVAATERSGDDFLRGQVQDPTAHRMGGVAGHAGLFSTADDLSRFALMLVQHGRLDGAEVLKPETVAQMTRPMASPGGGRRTLGWDAASAYSAGMDIAFGPSSFGHTGYTGCSLWIDPSSGSFLIVLTSRLHPDGKGDVKVLRRELAGLVAESLRAASHRTQAVAGAIPLRP